MPRSKNEKKVEKLNGQKIEVIIEQDTLKDAKPSESSQTQGVTDKITHDVLENVKTNPDKPNIDTMTVSSNDEINDSINNNMEIPPMPKLEREPRPKRITNKTLKTNVIKNMIDKQCDDTLTKELKQLWGLS
jgi:hypothetical protein